MRIGWSGILIMGLVFWTAATHASSELKVHGVEISNQKINVRVTSNGCTNNDSLNLQFSAGKLTITRVKPDKCRRLPHKIWLAFDLPPLRTDFVLTNKISL